MVMDAQTRHALHLRLDELVGPELAAPMMAAYDRPMPWHEVATKKDLDVLEHRLKSELLAAIDAQTRTIMFGMAAMLFGVTGGAAALAQHFG